METCDLLKERKFGELIKHQLKKHSLSMRKLGMLSGIDVATISRIVNGKQLPKLVHLKRFSEHLDISLDQLLEASGYTMDHGKTDNKSDIFGSLEAILKLVGEFQLLDPKATRVRIEQELDHCEQYAQTEEGYRMICLEFGAKMSKVNGVGPVIEHLKEMYNRYCDQSTPSNDRSKLGSALLYFILSADIIPDNIFSIGYLDDAIAVHLVLERLNKQDCTA